MMKKIAGVFLLLLYFVAIAKGIPQLLLLVSVMALSISALIAMRGKYHERRIVGQIWN
jgi:hypothetical protein